VPSIEEAMLRIYNFSGVCEGWLELDKKTMFNTSRSTVVAEAAAAISSCAIPDIVLVRFPLHRIVRFNATRQGTASDAVADNTPTQWLVCSGLDCSEAVTENIPRRLVDSDLAGSAE